jgi:hypothetical protein
MSLWNTLMPSSSDCAITFWQALGLLVLASFSSGASIATPVAG